jgi:hypothetical protein
MSGGSMWTMALDSPGAWTPACPKLIGIQHCWAENNWLRGTQIQHWLAMIAQDIPELAPIVDPVIHQR